MKKFLTYLLERKRSDFILNIFDYYLYSLNVTYRNGTGPVS